MDAEKNIRSLLKAKAEEIPSAPVIPEGVLRRSKVRRSMTALVATVVLIATSVGALAGVRSIIEKPNLDPVHPAPSVIERRESMVDEPDLSTMPERCTVQSRVARNDSRTQHSQPEKTENRSVAALGPVEFLAFLFGGATMASQSVTCTVGPAPVGRHEAKASIRRGAAKDK